VKKKTICEACGKELLNKEDIFKVYGHTLCRECASTTIGYCPLCGVRITFDTKCIDTIYGKTICEKCAKKYNFIFCDDIWRLQALQKDTYGDEYGNRYILKESIIFKKLIRHLPKKDAERLTNKIVSFIDQIPDQTSLSKMEKNGMCVLIEKKKNRIEITVFNNPTKETTQEKNKLRTKIVIIQ